MPDGWIHRCIGRWLERWLPWGEVRCPFCGMERPDA